MHERVEKLIAANIELQREVVRLRGRVRELELLQNNATCTDVAALEDSVVEAIRVIFAGARGEEE